MSEVHFKYLFKGDFYLYIYLIAMDCYCYWRFKIRDTPSGGEFVN